VLLIIRKFYVRPPLNVIDQANAADHLLLPPKNNVVIRQRNCSRLLHISIGRNDSRKSRQLAHILTWKPGKKQSNPSST
jgi:hypothetical protein